MKVVDPKKTANRRFFFLLTFSLDIQSLLRQLQVFRTNFIFNLKDFLIATIMNDVRKESSTLNSFGFENSVGLQILEMSYCLPFA